MEAFGLQPVILPDLSQSMDGHLGEGDFTPLTQGGASLRQIAQMGQSLGSFAIGVSLQRAASLLTQRSRGDVIALPHLMTLDHCDAFIHQLAKMSGRGVPAWIERQRGQLQDAMIDCHMWLQGQRMAMAAEGDLLAAWCDFARSQGMQPGPLVAPTSHPSLRQLPVEQVVPGDLEDLQQLLSHQPADLLVANSHARDLAEQFALPLIRVGFPLFDRLGEFRRVRQGTPACEIRCLSWPICCATAITTPPSTARRFARAPLPSRLQETLMPPINRQFDMVHADEWSMKVAFASSDYRHVDQHFGATPRLVVYGVKADRVTLLRVVEFPVASGHQTEKIAERIHALEDCVTLVSAWRLARRFFASCCRWASAPNASQTRPPSSACCRRSNSPGMKKRSAAARGNAIRSALTACWRSRRGGRSPTRSPDPVVYVTKPTKRHNSVGPVGGA